MNWWREFEANIQQDAPLAPLTWFRVGGCARFLFRPNSVSTLSLALQRAYHEGVPVRVLGAGANVLVSDAGFDGMVVKLNHPVFRTVSWQATTAQVGSGVDLMPFSRKCSERGLVGLECLAGVPATIGGAIRMNAGGSAGEIGAILRSVRLLRLDGMLETWPVDRLQLGYRTSAIGGCVIISGELVFDADDPIVVANRYETLFQQKQRTQPLADRSAGCIFKNPQGSKAGQLIDSAGLKGTRVGEAVVSTQHANFIVTSPHACASDILTLIELIQQRVAAVHGIRLQREIEVWEPVDQEALVA